MENDKYYAAQAQLQAGVGIGSIGRMETLKEGFERQLVQAKQNVTRLEELIKLMDETPNVTRILELMR